jgi:hypothetical protein
MTAPWTATFWTPPIRQGACFSIAQSGAAFGRDPLPCCKDGDTRQAPPTRRVPANRCLLVLACAHSGVVQGSTLRGDGPQSLRRWIFSQEFLVGTCWSHHQAQVVAAIMVPAAAHPKAPVCTIRCGLVSANTALKLSACNSQCSLRRADLLERPAAALHARLSLLSVTRQCLCTCRCGVDCCRTPSTKAGLGVAE